MKERALELIKKFVPMKDAYEWLTREEIVEAESYEKEYHDIKSKLSEDEVKWLHDQFAVWYSKMMHVETTLFIKPR